jgi:predicted TIM-barrel fold metal-dependent hydrolase
VPNVPPLLRPRSSDEYAPVPYGRADRRAVAGAAAAIEDAARRLRLAVPDLARDRRGTAATLRAIDAVHGGGFYVVPERAVHELEAAADAFDGDAPVIDVQTHLVDPTRWVGAGAAALDGFLRMADPERWEGPVDPRLIDGAAWAALVFGASETAIALLTSTPGPAEANVLTNDQIAAARDLVDRYADTGRVLTHTIVHPNVGPAELDAMADWRDRLRPSGWKCYTLYGPPTNASPTGGWFLDDEEIGLPFLERVDTLGPRVVAAHKGLGGPIPEQSMAAASPRDIGPAAVAFPNVRFVVYHSGYERDPDGAEGAYDRAHATRGVDRLVKSVEDTGVGPDGNVYAELGSTWFLMVRRPVEAAHVLGKLLVALGPDRIVWGTDSTWYGTPQPLIDAFRAFEIPERMQAEYGYPPLTRDAKERILGANARALYEIDDATADAIDDGRDRAWVANAARELADAIARVGNPAS